MNYVGKFYHTYEKGSIKHQGSVVKQLDAGVYECQLYSWLTGYPTDRIIVHDSDMSEWVFYNTQREWLIASGIDPVLLVDLDKYNKSIL